MLRVKRSLDKAMAKRKYQLEYRRKLKEKEEMLNRGENHEWVTIKDATAEVMVCKKTGWVPHNKIFLPIPMIKSYLKQAEIKERFEAKKEVEIERLADEYCITASDVKDIHEKILKLKKDFYLNYAKEQIEEMKKAVNFGEKGN